MHGYPCARPHAETGTGTSTATQTPTPTQTPAQAAHRPAAGTRGGALATDAHAPHAAAAAAAGQGKGRARSASPATPLGSCTEDRCRRPVQTLVREPDPRTRFKPSYESLNSDSSWVRALTVADRCRRPAGGCERRRAARRRRNKGGRNAAARPPPKRRRLQRIIITIITIKIISAAGRGTRAGGAPP